MHSLWVWRLLFFISTTWQVWVLGNGKLLSSSCCYSNYYIMSSCKAKLIYNWMITEKYLILRKISLKSCALLIFLYKVCIIFTKLYFLLNKCGFFFSNHHMLPTITMFTQLKIKTKMQIFKYWRAYETYLSVIQIN